MVDTVTYFWKNTYEDMNLHVHVDVYHFCVKFHAAKMNQIVLIGGFIKLVWEDENYFEPAL